MIQHCLIHLILSCKGEIEDGILGSFSQLQYVCPDICVHVTFERLTLRCYMILSYL